MNKIIISLLLFLLNIHLFGQKNKLKLDYIILNEDRKDTVWCEVTKIENNQIHFTTPNKDEWGKEFQDIAVCNYRMNGKVIHYERPNYLTSEPWEYVSPFEHGYAEVWIKTRSRYIDSTGKYESDCPFENIGKFRNGYAWAYKEHNLSIINSKCEIKYTVENVFGEMSAAFFDSIIVIYGMKEHKMNFGVVDYNFNVIIPHKYSRIHKSSSERYYLVGRPCSDNYEFDPELWGIYDIVAKKEIVSCSYPEKIINENGVGTYIFGDDFLKEVEKLKISIPIRDEIQEKLYPK